MFILNTEIVHSDDDDDCSDRYNGQRKGKGSIKLGSVRQGLQSETYCPL